MNLHFSPFPQLHTPRLQLRPLRPTDAPEIFLLRSDPTVLKYLPITPAKSLQDAHDYIEMINTGIANNEWILWGITLGDRESLIGTICFWNIDKEQESGEIGYVLLPQYHRQGIMSEATQAALDYALETIQFKVIEAVLTPKNSNSIGLLKKFDFYLDPQFNQAGEVRYQLLAPQK